MTPTPHESLPPLSTQAQAAWEEHGANLEGGHWHHTLKAIEALRPFAEPRIIHAFARTVAVPVAVQTALDDALMHMARQSPQAHQTVVREMSGHIHSVTDEIREMLSGDSFKSDNSLIANLLCRIGTREAFQALASKYGSFTQSERHHVIQFARRSHAPFSELYDERPVQNEDGKTRERNPNAFYFLARAAKDRAHDRTHTRSASACVQAAVALSENPHPKALQTLAELTDYQADLDVHVEKLRRSIRLALTHAQIPEVVPALLTAAAKDANARRFADGLAGYSTREQRHDYTTKAYDQFFELKDKPEFKHHPALQAFGALQSWWRVRNGGLQPEAILDAAMQGALSNTTLERNPDAALKALFARFERKNDIITEEPHVVKAAVRAAFHPTESRKLSKGGAALFLKQLRTGKPLK